MVGKNNCAWVVFCVAAHVPRVPQGLALVGAVVCAPRGVDVRRVVSCQKSSFWGRALLKFPQHLGTPGTFV